MPIPLLMLCEGATGVGRLIRYKCTDTVLEHLLIMADPWLHNLQSCGWRRKNMHKACTRNDASIRLIEIENETGQVAIDRHPSRQKTAEQHSCDGDVRRGAMGIVPNRISLGMTVAAIYGLTFAINTKANVKPTTHLARLSMCTIYPRNRAQNTQTT